MGTEQSTLSGEFQDNDNPSTTINIKFMETPEAEFEYVSNPVQSTITSADELEKVKKTVVGACDFCGKTFTDLITHLRTHYYEKPFLCRLCNMSFKTETELEAHKDSCEEFKRSLFPCSVCMNSSCNNPDHTRNLPSKPIQKPALMQAPLPTPKQTKLILQSQPQHQIQLKPEQGALSKSYKCVACKRTFNLCKQWKIHCSYCTSNSRFYKCPTCKKCFGMLIMSRLHQIHCKKALMNDYSCDHCKEKFNNKPDLVTHVLQKHKNTIQITLQSLLEESKQLKKEADVLKKIQNPVLNHNSVRTSLLIRKQ